MKKILTIAVVACALFMMGCASEVERKAEEFVKRGYEAGLSGNMELIQQIVAEEEAYVSTLTEEEKAEYTKAALEAASELLK